MNTFVLIAIISHILENARCQPAASIAVLPLPRGFGVGLQTCKNWVFSPRRVKASLLPAAFRSQPALQPRSVTSFPTSCFHQVILISLFPIIFFLLPMPTQTVIPGRQGGNILPGLCQHFGR